MRSDAPMTRAPRCRNVLVTEVPSPPLAPVIKTTLSFMDDDPSRDLLRGRESHSNKRFQPCRRFAHALKSPQAPGCSIFAIIRRLGKGFHSERTSAAFIAPADYRN